MDALLTTLAGYKDGFLAAQSLLTMVALVLGGAWAYFKFINGRVFAARLEPAIKGQLVRGRDHHFIVVTVFIKNVGLSRVDLNIQKSTIEVLAYPADNYLPEFHGAFLEELGVTRAMVLHHWIEPSECVTEERILALPPGRVLAVELRLRMLARERRWVKAIEWNAVSIVRPEAPAAAQVAPQQAASAPSLPNATRRKSHARAEIRG